MTDFTFVSSKCKSHEEISLVCSTGRYLNILFIRNLSVPFLWPN